MLAAILQRLLGIRVDGVGQEDILETARGAELQGRLHAVFPAEVETRLKNKIIMDDKFAGIKDTVDAIDRVLRGDGVILCEGVAGAVPGT